MPSVALTDQRPALVDSLNGREFGDPGWQDSVNPVKASATIITLSLGPDNAAQWLIDASITVAWSRRIQGNDDSLNNWADSRNVINLAPPVFLQIVLTDNLANYNDSAAYPHKVFSLAADSLANYLDSIALQSTGLNVALSDSLYNYAEQLKLFYALRPRLADALNTNLQDQAFPSQTATTSFNHWITEELIGAHDGVNKNFTISHTPVVESMSVFHSGIRLVRVVGSPTEGEAQYGISGTTVVMGVPIKVGQWCQARYFWDF